MQPKPLTNTAQLCLTEIKPWLGEGLCRHASGGISRRTNWMGTYIAGAGIVPKRGVCNDGRTCSARHKRENRKSRACIVDEYRRLLASADTRWTRRRDEASAGRSNPMLRGSLPFSSSGRHEVLVVSFTVTRHLRGARAPSLGGESPLMVGRPMLASSA